MGFKAAVCDTTYYRRSSLPDHFETMPLSCNYFYISQLLGEDGTVVESVTALPKLVRCPPAQRTPVLLISRLIPIPLVSSLPGDVGGSLIGVAEYQVHQNSVSDQIENVTFMRCPSEALIKARPIPSSALALQPARRCAAPTLTCSHAPICEK